MAKLYHVTNYYNKESILQQGLRNRIDKTDDCTDKVNRIINEYRPIWLDKLIDRSRCIFFNIEICPRDEGRFGICIDSEDLDKSKLYVCDYEIADRIWKDIIDAKYTGKHSGIDIKDSVNEYWASMIPFKEYTKTGVSMNEVEILYFSSVSKELISFINDQNIEFDEVLYRLLHYEDYHFDNCGRNYASIRYKGNNIAELIFDAEVSGFVIEFEHEEEENLINLIKSVISHEYSIATQIKKDLDTQFIELLKYAETLKENGSCIDG